MHVPPFLRRWLRHDQEASAPVERDLYERKQWDRIGTNDKTAQLLLSLEYAKLARAGEPLPSFDDVAFRAYSQNGEDGVLHFVFSLIQTTNKKCVEVCAGDGIECNTANLIINHDWTGLLVDGNKENVERGREFYRSLPDRRMWPPKFANAWITVESINSVIRDNGMSGEIDLFSLDIDGNDYWVWEALDCIQPRAVILEFEKAWDECVSMVYNPDNHYIWPGDNGPKRLVGASLPAFVKLGRKKGYRLVGAHACMNAVFLREGVGEEFFPEIPAAQVLNDPRSQWAVNARKEWIQNGLLKDVWTPV
ncbi:MAG: hypothetical protein ABFC77_02095 [Thermoguttaceae bacterium]